MGGGGGKTGLGTLTGTAKTAGVWLTQQNSEVMLKSSRYWILKRELHIIYNMNIQVHVTLCWSCILVCS